MPSLREKLEAALAGQLHAIVEVAADDAVLVKLPDMSSVDLTPEQLGSMVARTSNTYGRLARLAGMARANAKLARGRYDYKFKNARASGKNQAERTATAMESAQQEHQELIEAEALVQLIEGLENAARVGSESARKIFDKVDNMFKAAQREQRGQLQEEDFNGQW